MQSYNHPAWQHPRPPHHASSLDVPPPRFSPAPPRTRHASVSGPVLYPDPPSSFVPPSLTPGGQRARIWDRRTTIQRPRSSHGLTTSPFHAAQPASLYGDYFLHPPQAPLSPPPPLPQKPQALLQPLTNSLPPIPPKPPALAIPPASRIPLYPTAIPLPVLGPSSKPSEPAVPEPVFSPDENDMTLALTASASEARRREQELIAQEEEDLARALEESRLLSNEVYSVDDHSPSSTPPRSPSTDRASISAIKASAHPPEGESWLHLITPTGSTSSERSSLNEDESPEHQHGSDDDSDELSRGTPTDSQNALVSRDTLSPTPPLYANAVSNLVRSPPPPVPPLSYSNAAPSSSATSTTYLPSNFPPPDHTPISPSLSFAQSSSSDPSPMPSFAPRPSWSSVSSENSSRSVASELVITPSSTHPTSPNISLASSPILGPSEDEDAGPGPSSRVPILMSANHYVEQEMLLGVSLGFTRPVISTELLPMAGKLPNVITLPYGTAHVFHLQAPSWRRLLKLMAKLSGTRVEPTLDAISVAKHELKLRTVIQFVKIHHSASEWRTVLYLTTDYPLSPKVPNPHRYTNGDVTVLPYSYTLSPLPPLLRDGPESSVAKYYVVPSTPTTPYPSLPINFPNLAMYLQSAVQDSRNAFNDSSCGTRKLAQYIDGCYQTEAERPPIDQDGASKKGMGRMFKRVMGRNKATRMSGGNEEIYDLVTPFVPDEWG